ncbi:hypothetical protein DOTSEDRAFT_67715 [Lecanosticta acicola]|uniref:Disintegrin and metalloproteinase domain-containing protein B n=1 Tax=Lecanosticta acicola TaxID=111012 RepID=A0AAI8YWN4_9PEZI|nr:hypothetical protein DOTSEDRAFT_67715 [Lecanosticta acicola]
MRLPFTLLSLAACVLAPIAQASSTTRNPLSALSDVQNATIHTHNHRLTALSHFDLSFILRNDVWVKLRLEPNHDILGEDTTVTYLKSDGSLDRREGVDRLGHKVYKGTAWVQRPSIGPSKWQRVGWARVFVARDGKDPVFEGAFSVNHDHHHIQTTTNYRRTKHALDPEVEDGEEYMVLWRDSDIMPDDLDHHELRRDMDRGIGSCLSDQLMFNTRHDHPVYMAMTKRDERSYGFMDFSNVFRRQIDSTTGGNSAGGNLVASIGQSKGCPTARKVALVGAAADCNYMSEFNSSQAARENIINQFNTASAIWENTFNISLGLQNLTVMDASCPGTPATATEWNQACSPSVDIQARLNLFSAWRGNQQDNNSHWTLLSTCNTGSAVGLAWLGQACVQNAITTNQSVTGNGASTGSGSETVAGANVIMRTAGANEWQIIAHETGHTYGAVHDCDSQTCADSQTVAAQQCCPLSSSACNADGQYIMNPSTSQGVKQFSPCSVGNICSALERNSVNSRCLTDNRQVTTISGQQCGNGIVEPGEECDCGGEQGCGNQTCCDPKTCKFTQGAVCDDANEDCCHGCQFASNGTVCRASTGQCDPEETCSGTTAMCPQDQTKPNGESCGNGLQCASGQCTSRDQQCKSVMGSYTQGNDTYACDSSGCAISCASPEFGTGVCYGLQQNFLDGTVCGGGGRCLNGQCKGSTAGGQIKSWIDDHKAIVIGICSAIGGLLLFSLLSWLFRNCGRGRRGAKRVPSPPMPPPGGWQGWNGNPQGQPLMQQQQGNFYAQHPSQGWAGHGGGGGGGQDAWATPAVPPPAYPVGGSSVRYA